MLTALTVNVLIATGVFNVAKTQAACLVAGFCENNSMKYWCEDGTRQDVYGDPKNISDNNFWQY